MVFRIATVGLVIYCVSPVIGQGAQTSVPPPAAQTTAPASVVAKDLRFPIRMMERNIEVAIERAVENLAEQFREIDANLVIFAGKEKVRGTFFEDYGIVFYLEIPSLRPGIIDALQPYRPLAARPNGAAGEVVTQSLLTAKLDNSPCFRDSQHTRQCYRTAIQESLTDALLDATVVSLRPSDTLTLWALPDDDSASGGGPSQAMIFAMKGADLDAFRAKQISRDEMKKRISIKDF